MGRHLSYSSACWARQPSASTLRRLRKVKPQAPFKADFHDLRAEEGKPQFASYDFWMQFGALR
jgi:hypothetical protein